MRKGAHARKGQKQRPGLRVIDGGRLWTWRDVKKAERKAAEGFMRRMVETPVPKLKRRHRKIAELSDDWFEIKRDLYKNQLERMEAGKLTEAELNIILAEKKKIEGGLGA